MWCDTVYKALEIWNAAGATTSPVTWAADYGQVAQDESTGSSLGTYGTVAAGASATMVPMPTGTLRHQLLHLQAFNADNAARTLSIKLNDQNTRTTLLAVILQPGETLLFDHGRGWYCLDVNGQVKGGGAVSQSGIFSVSQGSPPWTMDHTRSGGVALGAARTLNGAVAPQASEMVGACQYVYDGTNWLPAPANTPNQGMVLQVGTVATRVFDFTNSTASGILMHLKVTNKVGAPTFTPALQFTTPDGVPVGFWTAAAAQTVNGDWTYLIHPNSGDLMAFTERKASPLPRTIRLVLFYGGNGTTDKADTLISFELLK